MLRLLGCGVEGGARLAVGTLGVTRAAEGRRAAFLPHGVEGFAAVFVFFGDGACASLMRRDNDGIDTIPPLLGRALPPAGFLNSDLSGAADLARADTGREGAVGFFCLGGREREGREKTEEKAGIGFVFRFDRRRPGAGTWNGRDSFDNSLSNRRIVPLPISISLTFRDLAIRENWSRDGTPLGAPAGDGFRRRRRRRRQRRRRDCLGSGDGGASPRRRLLLHDSCCSE